MGSICVFNIVDWSGCSGLLRESECLERKSTFHFTLPQKTVDNHKGLSTV
jgi:hypothetical protein